MPVTVTVAFNNFGLFGAELMAKMDGVVDHAAQALTDDAINRSPVDTGAMQASIKKEKVGEGSYEVSVQKDEAASGGKTYAHFVNGGTIFQRAQPFSPTLFRQRSTIFRPRR
jgi:HK97 gp10 family phage protein